MDDVLKEVRRIREEYAAQFNFDLWAIHEDLKKQERANGERLVNLSPRRVTHQENPVSIPATE